jgi:hypothetical protein
MHYALFEGWVGFNSVHFVVCKCQWSALDAGGALDVVRGSSECTSDSSRLSRHIYMPFRYYFLFKKCKKKVKRQQQIAWLVGTHPLDNCLQKAHLEKAHLQ